MNLQFTSLGTRKPGMWLQILVVCVRFAGCLRAAANVAARGSYTSITLPRCHLFLLDFYAKSEKDNLDSHDKKQLRMMVQTILRKD